MTGTVLILDNDATELADASLCLSRSGFSLLTCGSVDAALELIPQESAEVLCLLMTNATLAQGMGFDVAMQLMSRAPAVKVLVVSELRAETEHFQSFPSGTVLILHKPYSEQDLLGKLSELWGHAVATAGESGHNSEMESEADWPVHQSGLLDLAQDAVIVRSLNGRIRYWNQAAESLYGWPRDQAIGKPAHLFLKTVVPHYVTNIETALLESGRWEGELFQTVREGRTVAVSSCWAIRYGEDEIEILEINRDISNQKPMEEGLLEMDSELKSRIDDLRWAEQKFRALLEPSQTKW